MVLLNGNHDPDRRRGHSHRYTLGGRRRFLGATPARSSRWTCGGSATGLSKLFKFQENWLQYRTVVEDLDRQEVFYQSGIGDYAGLDATSREALFVERVENGLARATTQYVAAHRAAREAAPTKPSDEPNSTSPDK